MRTVTRILARQDFDHTIVSGLVVLDFHDRYRRRVTLSDALGVPFLLNLEKTRLLKDGDFLALDDGSILEVRAAEEDVVDITAHLVSDTMRIAWHIGNRHTPLQVLPDGHLRLRWDPVLAQMVENLGARTHRHRAPFDPEPGAYGQAQEFGHLHNHDH